jgi:hypothetical protein
MKSRIAPIGLAVIAGVVLMFGAASAQQKTISIGTGGTGGVYYPMGGAIANVLSKHLPGVQATAEVTGASVDNLKLIGSGQSEVGFTMADTALEALKGEEKFKGNKVDARTLLVLYPNRMHVVTTEGSGIEKMADFKGKRVSTGSPGSGTEVTAFRLIEAAGLDRDKDMKRERLSVAESVNAIKDGKIDAFFWVGGLPTAAVTDLGATPGVKIKMIDQADLVDKMNAKHGQLYGTDVIPAGTYPGQTSDNQIAVVWNLLVVPADLPEKLAYDIIKTIFDYKADLVAVHQEAKSIDLKNQTRANSSIPYHPGAVKYLSEKGVQM